MKTGASPIGSPLSAVIDDQARNYGIKAAAADKKSSFGPFVLGSFMFCILCNCLGYVYFESKDFVSELKITSFKKALTHDYRDEAAAALTATQVAPQVYAAPLPPAPVESWHRVAAAGDRDDLRVALRLAYANPQGRAEVWQSLATGHQGMVLPISASPAGDAKACRQFRITRQGNGAAMADTVEFCADGAIRQGAR